MTQRYQVLQDVYLHLDGQPQIVLSGTVFDAADNFGASASNLLKLSPGEAAGALGPHGKPTAVRNVRTR